MLIVLFALSAGTTKVLELIFAAPSSGDVTMEKYINHEDGVTVQDMAVPPAQDPTKVLPSDPALQQRQQERSVHASMDDLVNFRNEEARPQDSALPSFIVLEHPQGLISPIVTMA